MIKNMLRKSIPAAISAAMASSLFIYPARAETTSINIADSGGLTHLPVLVAVERKLIEKHAAALGLANLMVRLQRVGSGVVVGELLLAGKAQVGVSGNVPLFVMSDKTRGKQKIKGIMALAKSNQFLLSRDLKIKSIDDYGANDRIAMPSSKVSTYALTLQMAAAKKFGWGQRNKFESNSVSMANLDAMAEMVTGSGEVKSHFTVLPYSAIELASGKVHVVLNSRDVVGFPYTSTAAIATEGFKADNPKTFQAVVLGLKDAIDFINEHPRQAAAVYLKYEKYPEKAGSLVSMLKGLTPDQLSFSEAPQGTQVFTELMFKDGLLKTRPSSWKQYWFDDVWTTQGD